MHVLLATYGSRGDVEPMVALAVELQARGAQVTLCAPPDDEFRALLARAGVTLALFPRSWRSWEMRATTAEERVLSVDDFVAEHIDATYDTVAAAASGCDVLAATGMLHFVAQSAAERAGIPHRFVVFAPGLLEPMRWQPLVVPALDAHRVSLGLPPVADVRSFLLTDRPWLAADPVLSPHPEAAVEQTAAWVLRDDRPLPDDLAGFLDAGDPPVYVGFGSMRVPQQSARATIEAIRRHGRRVVVGRGWADLALLDDSGDGFAVGEVNQQALFRRVAAVVHHGGAGTTATAARAGVPQVIVPQAVDQSYWGERIMELGIGARLDGATPTDASMTEALETVLAEATGLRASKIAASIGTEGAADAARRLLAPPGA